MPIILYTACFNNAVQIQNSNFALTWSLVRKPFAIIGFSGDGCEARVTHTDEFLHHTPCNTLKHTLELNNSLLFIITYFVEVMHVHGDEIIISSVTVLFRIKLLFKKVFSYPACSSSLQWTSLIVE